MKYYNLFKSLITVCLKALPLNTIRDWGGIKYIKTPSGWQRLGHEKTPEKPKPSLKGKVEEPKHIWDMEQGKQKTEVANKFIEQNKGKDTDYATAKVGDNLEVPYDNETNEGGYSGKIIYADKDYTTILTNNGNIEDVSTKYLENPDNPWVVE